MTHYMVDLETMGNKPDAPITSIGVVEFDLSGTKRGFYERVDLSSSVHSGGVIDPETVKWWLQQSSDAQLEMTKGRHIVSVLQELSSFLTGEVIIWGNGAAFDNVILAAHYDRLNIQRPWKFWNDRCFRTIRAMNEDVQAPERTGTHHNALDDAKTQAMHLINICNEKGISL